MVRYTSTPIPDPVTVAAGVYNDVMTRTLIVKRPQGLSGYQNLLWRESHQALQQGIDTGWWTEDYVWGGTTQDSRIVHGVPGTESLSLAFHFPTDRTAYSGIVSKPYYALVTMDKSQRRFIGVKFLNKG
jgi:hypothetical protein